MESSKSDSESPDQAEFRSDNKCAQCMQVLYLQSEQVNGIHNLEDIHIQSSTSTATDHQPIFTALWHWGARILRNFDLLARARARAGHNMSPATAPCARAPGGAMRAPGSRCIFTVLAISAMRGPQNGWLAASYFSEFMHAFRAACMHSGLPACM